jgi:hypothetical protein
LTKILFLRVETLHSSGELNQNFLSLKKQRMNRLAKFILKWIRKKDYYCWDDEETFECISNFLKKNFAAYLRALQTNISQQTNTVETPNIEFSKSLVLLELKPLHIAKLLMDISRSFMSSIYLFQYFREQQNYSSVQVWTAHYNNVRKNCYFLIFFNDYFLFIFIFYSIFYLSLFSF